MIASWSTKYLRLLIGYASYFCRQALFFITDGKKSCEIARITTFNFRVLLRSYKAWSIWFDMVSASFSLPINSISIPRKSCFFPVVCSSFQNFSSILSTIIELTMLSICEMLLLSTNHPMVHLFSFVNLFEMQRSYELSLNPKYDNVVENSS